MTVTHLLTQVCLLTGVRTQVLDDTSPHLNHAESRLTSYLARALVRAVRMIARRNRLNHANGKTLLGDTNLLETNVLETNLLETNLLETNLLETNVLETNMLGTNVLADNNVLAIAINENKARHCD